MKKIGLISSAFLLTLALAACGGGKSTENTDSRSSAAESTTVESTKASATKESSSKAATKSSDAKPLLLRRKRQIMAQQRSNHQRKMRIQMTKPTKCLTS